MKTVRTNLSKLLLSLSLFLLNKRGWTLLFVGHRYHSYVAWLLLPLLQQTHIHTSFAIEVRRSLIAMYTNSTNVNETYSIFNKIAVSVCSICCHMQFALIYEEDEEVDMFESSKSSPAVYLHHTLLASEFAWGGFLGYLLGNNVKVAKGGTRFSSSRTNTGDRTVDAASSSSTLSERFLSIRDSHPFPSMMKESFWRSRDESPPFVFQSYLLPLLTDVIGGNLKRPAIGHTWEWLMGMPRRNAPTTSPMTKR